MRRLLIALLGVTLLVLCGAGPAAAHGSLAGASPGPGDQPKAGGDRLDMEFRAEISTAEPVRVELKDKAQQSMAEGPPTVTGTTLTMPLRALAPGLHKVSYTVTATDGHVIDGGYYFKVTPGPPPAEPGIGIGWWLGGGGVLLLLVAAVVVLSLRRKRSAETPNRV